MPVSLELDDAFSFRAVGLSATRRVASTHGVHSVPQIARMSPDTGDRSTQLTKPTWSSVFNEVKNTKNDPFCTQCTPTNIAFFQPLTIMHYGRRGLVVLWRRCAWSTRLTKSSVFNEVGNKNKLMHFVHYSYINKYCIRSIT